MMPYPFRWLGAVLKAPVSAEARPWVAHRMGGIDRMSWPGYLALGLTAMLVGHLLWVRVRSTRIQGRSVADLAELFPELSEGRGRAVIYCYMEHCGPCRKMAPVIDRLREQHRNLFKLDVQGHPQLARKLGISATPTTLLVEDGTVVKVLLGAGAAHSVEVFLGSA